MLSTFKITRGRWSYWTLNWHAHQAIHIQKKMTNDM